MIYFILWVLFIVGLIAAVPIAHVLENRGRRAAFAATAEEVGGDDPFAEEDEMPLEEAPADEDAVDFGGEPAMQQEEAAFEEVDDFAEFEEDFK